MNERLNDQPIIYNDEQLRARADYWQQAFELQDWTIKTVIRRATEMETEDVAGEVKVVYEKKSAIIRILDPVDYGEHIIAQNMETTLIHEMLHILFWSVEKPMDDHLYMLYHQRIDVIARALFRVHIPNTIDDCFGDLPEDIDKAGLKGSTGKMKQSVSLFDIPENGP